MTPRKLAALRAMAENGTEHEREIAQTKLDAIIAKETADAEWQAAWADYQEHERIANRLAQQAEDRRIAEMVRRWERGTYSGMTIGGGASGARIGK